MGLSAELERGHARFVRGIDPATLSLSWQFESPHGTGLLDEETAVVVRNSQPDSVEYRSCSIGSRDLARDANGRATNITVQAATYTNTAETCEGDPQWWPSTSCDFKLRDTVHNQALSQVIDDDDGPGANVAANYVVTVPCTTTTPVFNTSNTNFREQHEAYGLVKQAARTARLKFFSQFAPQDNRSVEINTDYDGNVAPAYYSDFWSEIYFDNGAVNAATAYHEYGHHVANMYGDFSDICNPFIDEGDSIDEAIGAATAATVLAGTPSLYGAASNLGIGMAPHTNAASRFVYTSALCTTAPIPHNAAGPFAQAYWEVLTNRNCSTTFCTAALTSYNSGATALIPNAAQTTFQAEIARSLAYALSATPSNTTYASIVSFMNDRWLVTYTPAQSVAIRAVFTHHGI